MSRRRTRSRVIPERAAIRRRARMVGLMLGILVTEIAALPVAADDRPRDPDVPF